MKQLRFTAALALLAVLYCGPAFSQSLALGGTPLTISYQALVVGNDGKPVNADNSPVTLALVDSKTGETVWSDAVEADIHDGVLNLVLGAHAPLPSAQSLDRPLKLQIGLRGSPPITTDLTASPYALNVPDSSITAAKMGTDYISAVTIDGQRVTSKGGPLNLQTGEGLQLSYNEEANAVTIGVPKGATPNNAPGGGAAAYWGEYGNDISASTGAFVGTTSNDPLELRASNERMVKYVEVGSNEGPNITGGFYTNSIDVPVKGSVIAGGGKLFQPNWIGGNYGFIGGGINNSIFGATGTNGRDIAYSAIVGGQYNRITSQLAGNPLEGTQWHLLGGGDSNTIYIDVISGQENPTLGGSTLVGGKHNSLCAPWGFIGGGENNVISSSIPVADDDSDRFMRWDVLGGGQGNHITRFSSWSFLGSGHGNVVGGGTESHRADASVIAGGDSNQTNAVYGSIVGGSQNKVLADTSFIGAGGSNTIAQGSSGSTIMGGIANTIDTVAPYSAIAGGVSNHIVDAAHSSIGGGEENTIELRSPYGTIAGGYHNRLDSADYAFIGGGTLNRIQGKASAITGGESNEINDTAADHNFIGGGLSNIENNPSLGVIAGGWENLLDTNAWASSIVGGWKNDVQVSLSFLGGGEQNTIHQWDGHSGLVSGEKNEIASAWTFLGSGRQNYAHGVFTALVGGDSNIANLAYGFVGGGYHNNIDYNSDTATLVGGARNYINFGSGSLLGAGTDDTLLSAYSVLVGGTRNVIDYGAEHSILVGGDSNRVQGNFSVVGGGRDNTASSDDGFIGGGSSNLIDIHSGYASLAGGDSNRIVSEHGTVSGGRGNVIEGGAFATISGGAHDTINAAFGVIGGGTANRVASTAPESFLGGGSSNKISATSFVVTNKNLGDEVDTFFTEIATGGDGVISGGFQNSLGSSSGTIGGGDLNTITSSAPLATITGGLRNRIMSADATIAGGNDNLIDSNSFDSFVFGDHNEAHESWGTVAGGFGNVVKKGGLFAAVPGGIGLTAQSFGQLVAGRFNKPSGSSTPTVIIGDDPLFILGNGTKSAVSNAFEVSNNGHSTAFQSLSSGSPTIAGATYEDNTIVAWGNVSSAGVLTAGIGCSVSVIGAGMYKVTLNVNDPGTGTPHAFSAGNAAIVATPDINSITGASMITASTLTAGPPATFVITTYTSTATATPIGFQFHVVAQ